MSELPVATPDPAPKTLPLVFDEPRGRRKPPRHLADLTADERKELVTGLGLPGVPRQAALHPLLLAGWSTTPPR